ncbi:MAG: DUF4340 domain-containing protein [Lachnospiraceae bacterium]|nr:DUF4340 domain-containing protein [Lachnospiraceae bacterium]
MKRKKAGLLIILVVLVLLIGAFFGLRKYNEIQDEKDSADESVSVLDIDTADVTEYSVTNSYGEFIFTRSEDGWLGSGDAAGIDKLDIDEIESRLGDACTFTADYAIDEPLDLSEYGLDDPDITVTLKTKSRGDIELLYGDENSSVHMRYVLVNGDDNVYLVSMYKAGRFDFTEDGITKKEDSGDNDQDSADDTEGEI